MSSAVAIDNFLSSISSNSGCIKSTEMSFRLFDVEIKQKKIKLGKRDVRNIILQFYGETCKFPELNEFWGRYTNILQYNNKEVRRLIVRDLIEKDVTESNPCPHRVLCLIFQDKEMVKIIDNYRIFIQAALQVKDLCPDYLHYLGGDSMSGKNFRRNLGNFIVDRWQALFFPGDGKDVPKAIDGILNYLGISRSRLNQIDDCDIISNFENFKRVWRNVNLDAIDQGKEEDYFIHSHVIQNYNSFNYTKLISDYKKHKIRKEIFLDNLYSMMIYEERREELLNYLKKNDKELYSTFKDLKIDGDCELGVIPKEIARLYTSDDYPSVLIEPMFECPKLCDKSSHHDWFKLTTVEDSETAINIINDLKTKTIGRTSKCVLFMDIKLSIKDSCEEITYINIFFPRSKFISFNLDKISNSKTSSMIVDFLFSTKVYQIICYNDKEIIKKFTQIFGDVFSMERNPFPIAEVIGLINRLNTTIEATGTECSIPKCFPNTWRNVYKYKSVDYSNDNDDYNDGYSDDESTITKQQRKCIRKMSLNMEFRSLCYLTTGYDYDESESLPYSFWYRKPLRSQQSKEMMTRLLALYDILFNINEAMNKIPEYDKFKIPVLRVRVGGR